jgi:choline dehydrogenase-like flavoprotein
VVGPVLYAAQWQRNLPSDFRVRSLDGVADDWPLDYDELAPYYDRVERDFGVSGLGGDPGYPAGTPPPLPPAPLTPGGRRVAAAHNALGWHWWPGSNAIATRRYGELEACQRRAACMWGCPHRAKGSVDVTHWPRALRLGARLLTGARVLRIETDRTGRATGALWRDRRGVVHSTSADAVVLAANGVGTPRLLQLSSSPEHPDGLANSSGRVGTRLMLHPFAGGHRPVRGRPARLAGRLGAGHHVAAVLRDRRRPGLRARRQVGAGADRRSAVGRTQSAVGRRRRLGRRLRRPAADALLALGAVEHHRRGPPGAAQHRHAVRHVVDGDGLPAPVVTYRTSENSRSMLAFNLERARESLLAAGAYRVVDMPQVRGSGWHLLGTAVMGDDPSSSVVDRWGQSHDVPNLWIFDGSTWPTSSGMNPTATIAPSPCVAPSACSPCRAARGHGSPVNPRDTVLARLADALVPGGSGCPRPRPPGCRSRRRHRAGGPSGAASAVRAAARTAGRQ